MKYTVVRVSGAAYAGDATELHLPFGGCHGAKGGTSVNNFVAGQNHVQELKSEEICCTTLTYLRKPVGWMGQPARLPGEFASMTGLVLLAAEAETVF